MGRRLLWLWLAALLVAGRAAAAALQLADAGAAEIHRELRRLYDARDMVGLRAAAAEVIARRPEGASALSFASPLVARDPRHRSALQYLGVAQYALGDLRAAADAFERAVAQNASDASSWLDLGNVYLFEMRVAEAAAALEVAVERLGAARDAHALFKARNWMADWRGRDEMLAEVARAVAAAQRDGSRTAMNPVGFLELPLETLRAMVRLDYTLALPGVDPPLYCASASCLQLRSPRLRVGFVSSDFGVHPVATLIRGLLAALAGPGHAVEVVCLSLSDAPSWWRTNISRTVDRTVSLQGRNAREAADAVRALDLHVLVDLNGHTVHSGLGILQFRPAPVQVAFLGYPMTTGTDFVDFVVSDRVATPPDMASGLFTEKKILLPTHYIANDYMQMFGHAFAGAPPPPPTRLPGGQDPFVFATFSNWQKIDPPVFKAWMEILARVPSSVMWFLRYSGHEEAEKHLRAEADSLGVDGRARLIFTELKPWIDHIGAKRAANLVLDTPLKNGHTTMLDALCAGVPVISLEGVHMSNRAGSSALHTLGLDVLTVNSLKEYADVAVHVATHPKVYQRLRHLVEQRRFTHALFDTAKYSRSFDDAVRLAWETKKLAILGGGGVKHVFPPRAARERALQPRQFPIHSALGEDKDVPDYEGRVQKAVDGGVELRLHIGGRVPAPSWWIVDVNDGEDVDFVLDMRNLYPFPDSSVSAVYASHVLEHCDYGVTNGVDRTLREWRRVLKPDGALFVSVPDLLALSTLYANASTTADERLALMRVMFGGQTDARDVHMVGFDEAILGAYLSTAGFCDLVRVDDFGLFPDSSTASVKCVPVSLNVRARPCGRP